MYMRYCMLQVATIQYRNPPGDFNLDTDVLSPVVHCNLKRTIYKSKYYY